MPAPLSILSVGATGSVGRHVIAEGLRAGHRMRALVRRPDRARLPEAVRIVEGDVADPASAPAALDGVDAVILTLGADAQGPAGREAVEYGGVRNILEAARNRRLRIVLMTTIGVTERESAWSRRSEAHDWKRRAERLVRASGQPYAIVRPGWFDCNGADELRLAPLQGDRRHAGTPEDGAVSRRQIGRTLIEAARCDEALRKTFELVAIRGPETEDFPAMFAALAPDAPGALDGVRDLPNMPLDAEPERVRAVLRAMHAPVAG